MDKEENRQKAQDVLDNECYCKLKKDPTLKLERTIASRLKDLEKKREIDDHLRKRITPQQSCPPQLYGLPKIHKPKVPLRPIVSSIGSATYHLMKELSPILTLLKGSYSLYIRNSSHFAERIQEVEVRESDAMVSFDVKSLFTRVSIPEALQVVHD